MKKNKARFLALAEKYRDVGIAPACEYFGRCGGCRFQDIAYDNQLLLKREYLAEILNGVCDVGAVRPSSPLHYRNRMDFVTAFGNIGLRKSGSHRHVVDIDSCAIMQQKSNDAFRALRPLLAGIEDYNYLRHTGYLRYAVLRQARFTGQVMVNFVIAERENRLRHVISGIVDRADSVSILLSDGLADLSFGEVIEDVKVGAIEEIFDGIRFAIAPNSFFQSNSEVALEMYRRIREEVSGNVLDLYSGVGSISLFAAARADRMTGVEMLAEGVSMANRNREANGIMNADFICADVLDFVKHNETRFDTVVLDPPRSGMNPRVVRYIRQMAPGKIVYMSCNPVTFRDDCALLDEYAMQSFEAFDMFPQTPHIETLAVLRRRGA